jgi:hypothetical protein
MDNWSPEAKQQATEQLKTILGAKWSEIANGSAPTLWFLLDASRSNMLGYVRLFAVGKTGDRELTELTLPVSKVTGLELIERNGRFWLKVNNPGYDRTLFVSEKLWQALGFAETSKGSLFYRNTL